MQMNPGYGGQLGAPPPMQSGGGATHEFSQHENQSISTVGSRAKLSGAIAVAAGIIGLLVTILNIVVLVVAETGVQQVQAMVVLTTVLPSSIVQIVAGLSYRKAGASLVAVTVTQGNDVQHMMESLKRFKQAFQLETLLAAAAAVLGFVAGIAIGALS